MMKRRLLNSPPPEEKVSNIENVELSKNISSLPKVLIVDIFSRLTILEAARTSVVSYGWRYWWTFNANLDFYALKTIWNCSMRIVESYPFVSAGEEMRSKYRQEMRSKYINWVDKVLELHRGSINEFGIYFDLDDDNKSYITNWIHTALAKGVQKLELDFAHFLMLGHYNATRDINDVIQRANAMRYGLATGVFTGSLETANTMMRVLKAGIV
ncbi:hypothetical protein LWI29_021195 [Acer saccharum]|uniref:F-box domain-containing protein n=1 Tax=Acer saccharum TaxID=4024 RepID=A0AA39W7G9_ACESA|nr:hypothetical protein LWI29_021195 [Acer saccharum]